MLVETKQVLVPVLLMSSLWVSMPARCRDAHREESIVGKWDSMIRGGDGLGITFEFLPDGSFTQTSDYERTARYKLEGSRLSIKVWNSRDSREDQQVFELRFEANELIERDLNGGREIRMKPVGSGGKPAENSLVGEWFSENYPGATSVVPLNLPLRFPAFVEFTKNGQVYFRGPLKSKSGHYEFSNSRLTTTLEGAGSFERKVHLSSGPPGHANRHE
jgi:hypothetical protein